LAEGRLVAIHSPGEFLRAPETEVKAFVSALGIGELELNP